MKITYIAIVFAAFAVQNSQQDECHWRELDLCSATTLASLDNPPIPKNEEDIEKQCRYFKESLECARNYSSKCMTSVQKELVSYVNDQSEQNYNTFCTAGSEMRKNVIKHSKCLRETWNDQRVCVDDAQAALETLRENKSDKRITIACCSYQRFRQCGTDIMKKKCGDETVDFVNQLITFYASDFPNIVCTNYNSNDNKCKEALPPVGTKPKGTNQNDPISRFIGLYIRT